MTDDGIYVGDLGGLCTLSVRAEWRQGELG